MNVPKLFISYARTEEKFINRLCKDLDLKGVKYWRDVKDIVAGDSIIEKIEHGLMETDYFCLCLSKESVNRDWVIREYRTALNLQLSSRGKKPRIVPLLVNDCTIPPLLLDIRYADFRTNYVFGLNELLVSIKVNPATFVPYLKFIRHIEAVEPMESFLNAAIAGQPSSLEDSWVQKMFALLEDGIRDSQLELEEFIDNNVPLKLVKKKCLPTANSKSKFLLVTPPIQLFGGYDYLNFLDDVDSYTVAKSGFHEFLGHLINYRKLVLNRALYLLPRTFTYSIETYPDGNYQTFLDFDKILKHLKTYTPSISFCGSDEDTYYPEHTTSVG
jgi:hypothetical protein